MSAKPLRVGPISLRWRPRTLLVSAGAAVLLAALGVVSIGLGEVFLPPERVIAALTGFADPLETMVVLQLRVPRVLLGGLVGACLAVCGAIMQATTRNGLASPDLLGVTQGASAGAVAAIVLNDGHVGGLFGALGVGGSALVGGLSSAVCVALLLRYTKGGTLLTVLIGVGISATFSGLTSWLLITAELDDAQQASVWLTGSLSRGSWEQVTLVAATLLVTSTVLLPMLTRLPALELGFEMATSLGHQPARDARWLLLITVALTSIAVCASGPIGFVALACPHVCRLLTKGPRAPMLTSGLVGAVMVVGSDLFARLAFSPLQLPVGAVTAVVGAPMLIWLLTHRQGGMR